MNVTATKVQPMRPPVVVVLGHVDHGKTSLLDYLRKTSVVAREKGGITQSIGASVVSLKDGGKITFIDTPGHAAFANMRSRGAKVADVAVLVVAGDDGVKTQTKEALEIIRSEGLPFVVAVTKIDLATSSIPFVQSQLEAEGVVFEGRGGEVPCVGVSSVTGAGINELLEIINLVAQIKGLSGDDSGQLEAVVIETFKDKAGPKASVIVRNGTLCVGQEVFSDTVSGRVRAIYNDLNQQVQKVSTGYPACILGLSGLPQVGSKILQKGINVNLPAIEIKKNNPALSDITGKLAILVKVHNEGTRESILAGLPKNVIVVDSGVGDVTESDVFTAKSSTARIIAFEVKVPVSVSLLAKTEGVEIECFDVIYKLIDRLEELISKGNVEELGKAKILAIFPFDNKKVCGVKVMSGKLTKSDRVVLMSQGISKGELKIVSMKRGKEDINEAKQGEECGILCMPQLDFSTGDMIVSIRK
ncbi:MAG: GTP-binding protein [Patescibacteria group bacterium]|nr:GTP-binding protein [Patescibacteria group bacterium]